MQASKLETLTRLGFAARGLMYILIGFLALKFGKTEGSGGALEYLNSGAGKLLLVAMSAGFLAYGLWRLSEALIDTEGHGDDVKGKVIRTAGLASGIVHLGLAAYALSLSVGTGGKSGSADGTEQGAATALTLPGGQTLLMVAAAALLLAGAYQFVKAVQMSFLRHLDQRVCGKAWVQWSGRLGYAARGSVFLIIAYSLLEAARESSAQEAGGSGEALGSLPGNLQILVAGGLALFGLFSLIEARYRRINNPRVLERLGTIGH